MINEVVLVGRMVKDPELRYTGEGTPVATFRLAVNRNYKNQEGVIEADFVSCTAWRNLAKTTADYCRKGQLVGVTGRIQTRRFEAKDGTTVYVTDIVVDNVRFLEKKRDAKTNASASGKEVKAPSAENQEFPPPPQNPPQEQAEQPVEQVRTPEKVGM
ncbi:Single-stranded DNA-binding protein SsbB [Bacillus sp. THAF10]|uniref:single-stranded DNA-binding protein n=1 Tax=Bacillus sp. THAF10 TaxID=2587848 RepID=UPI00126968F5|nr:single-stranded DNA-binding protein [Bacillus sp. THAF10]QFT90706.1 Single-stranded DNA-binding protein SsbB [Bacillus sp. THAF10]